jgi:hypothetical protein
VAGIAVWRSPTPAAAPPKLASAYPPTQKAWAAAVETDLGRGVYVPITVDPRLTVKDLIEVTIRDFPPNKRHSRDDAKLETRLIWWEDTIGYVGLARHRRPGCAASPRSPALFAPPRAPVSRCVANAADLNPRFRSSVAPSLLCRHRVQITVVGEGAVLVSANAPTRRKTGIDDADPVVAGSLGFLEAQMTAHPEDIVVADTEQLRRIGELVEGVVVG